MEELKRIWNMEQDIYNVSFKSSDKTMKKTRSVISDLLLILKFELLIALVIMGFVIMNRETFSVFHLSIIFVIFVLGTILNLITQFKINRINIYDMIHDFVKQQISVIRSFIWQYVIMLQGVCIIFFIYAWLESDNTASITLWLGSANGFKTMFIIVLIDICLSSLCYLFYGRRLKQLSQILKEYES